MPEILVLGAGRSASYLIDYLLDWSKNHSYTIRIADQSVTHLENLKAQNDHLEIQAANIGDADQRLELIKGAFIVVSMLPAFMHPLVAKDCLTLGIHLATASYESKELQSMSDEIASKGLIFLNECGLDPGIDHMSAMKIFENLKNQGYKVAEFHSYCGGLVAPSSIADNPWGYKFSWNPRNVILAGQGTARFLEQGKLRFMPYNRLFANSTRLDINGIHYDGYPNRDSIGYREVYGLHDLQTMIRGTLRFAGFTKAWDVLVQLGLTDDSYKFPISSGMTYRDFTTAFFCADNHQSIEEQLLELTKGDQEAADRFVWTGLLSEEKITIQEGTPAMIVQELLEKRWKLMPADRDMIVMQHIVKGEKECEQIEIKSTLYLEGDNSQQTAMAKTVGLPLAIAVKLICSGQFNQPGLFIPVVPELFNPILQELEEEFGIIFNESEEKIRSGIRV
jgi:saccharopine dehydrogenase-like NADP-dependent oxidoreductase